jgi:hypothetical protein
MLTEYRTRYCVAGFQADDAEEGDFFYLKTGHGAILGGKRE